MDNHQLELAHELSKMGLVYASGQTIPELLEAIGGFKSQISDKRSIESTGQGTFARVVGSLI
jgi:UDP-N-acetylglucosamine transferase subunit ALG13